MDIFSESLEIHKKLKGKIDVIPKHKVNTKHDLSLLYTPGVASSSLKIKEDKNSVFELTGKWNNVAVVTDGSAVLGLGNIGCYASLPVMEGKSLLFKEFAGINAFPLAFKTQDSNKIIDLIKEIEPVFGGVNLEDISAPRCFEIEESLQDIGIPVVHDDQHGAAIAVYAAMINAAKVAGKKLSEMKIVVIGAGAAGTAISKMLSGINCSKKCEKAKELIVVDINGILDKNDKSMDKWRHELALKTNPNNITGGLNKALVNADAVVGVSTRNVLNKEMIKSMNSNAIVFALANPEPEIMPEKAIEAGALIVATGRSDYSNQVNNALVFPGLFKGLLESKAKRINEEIKFAAANALASIIKNPEKDNILPSIFNKKVVSLVSKAVKETAKKTL